MPSHHSHRVRVDRQGLKAIAPISGRARAKFDSAPGSEERMVEALEYRWSQARPARQGRLGETPCGQVKNAKGTASD